MFAVALQGWQGGICPRTHHFWASILRSKCYVIIPKCQMSADANNCDFTKCRMPVAATQVQNLIKITKFRKASSYEI